MRKNRNVDWQTENENGNVPTWDRVQVSVLMDLRDELQKLNTLLHCPNFQEIPHTLRNIRRNTAPKPKKRKPRK